MWEGLRKVVTGGFDAVKNTAKNVAFGTERGSLGENPFAFKQTAPGWGEDANLLQRIGGAISGGLHSGGVGAIAAGGLIGGTASYATGGEFWQGAAFGAGGAFAARTLHRGLAANSEALHKGLQTRSNAALKASGGESAGFSGTILQNPGSIQRIQERHAMMAGAGLLGFAAGGDRHRKSYRSGFNAHRGNTF